MDKLEKKIENKVIYLRKKQDEALNIGDKHTYQCICNELKGMAFVSNLLKNRNN